MNIRFLTWHFCNSSYEKLQHKFKDESRSRVKMYALLIFNMRESIKDFDLKAHVKQVL